MAAPVMEISKVNEIARPLFEQYKVNRVAIFGSFAKGDIKNESDIDILVSFENKYDLLDIIGLKQDLEEILGRKVDLLTFNSLKDDEFSQIIQREARTIYEKN
jgi:predicted nucleotidyltransferase